MISIITPTFNRKDMLLQLISSLKMQTYKNWEIIIVDDCSTDGTFEALKEYDEDSRVRYFLNQQNMGPGYNRGFGLKQSFGEFVIYADDDDYYSDSSFFEKAMEIYEKDREESFALVTANSDTYFAAENKRIKGNVGCVGRINGIDFLTELNGKYQKPNSTFTSIFRKETLKKAELDTIEMVNDYTIYLRALLFGDAYVFEESVGDYRIHESNISFNISKTFLLQNAKERIWVREKLLEVREKKVVHDWWQAQMLLLAQYFYLGSQPSIKDAVDVALFIFKSQFSLSLYLRVIYLFIIYKPIGYAKKLKKKFQ